MQILHHTNLNFDKKHNLQISAKNTAWCLLGCSIGDYTTILFFQYVVPHVQMWLVMLSAIFMALVSGVMLETFIMSKQLPLKKAFKVALGMSFISMIMMEVAANIVSVMMTGGDRLMLTWWSFLPSTLAGFLSAWPYNYYKLKKHGKSCHAH